MLFTPARFSALLAFSAACFAAPNPSSTLTQEIPLVKKRNTLNKQGSSEIDFPLVQKHLDHVKAKYAANVQAYKTNTGNDHPLASRSIVPKKRATGSVSLTDEKEELWHGAISFGGQSIQIDFDTGSADVIVNKNAYTPGSTAKDTGKTFSTAYGDGTTASGSVYLDNLSIGGLSASGAAIGRSNNQFISGEGDDGIAGMSYPSLNQLGEPPFFDTLISAKAVSKGVFTFTLSTGSSQLYLGGVAPNVGDLTYVKVDSSDGFWSTSGSINGKSTAGIQDTGTTLIVAPTSYASALFDSLSGVTSFTQDGTTYGAYDCSSPPTLTLKFGSFSKALSKGTTSFGTTNDGQCVLSVVGEDVGIDSVIFGDSWLQNVHAVFDRDNNRVGFSSQ